MWKSKLCVRKQTDLLFWEMKNAFPSSWNSFTWSSFTAEMKNQPGDKCFACKRASSSPRALYPASKEHWEALSSLPQREQVPVDPFSWFTVESVLCFQFSPHIDGRTILAALWEHWLYKDLERETVYCLVPARTCSLHYARGLQLSHLEFQSWPMNSWQEAEQPHCPSCFKVAYLCCYTWQPRKTMQHTVLHGQDQWLNSRDILL